MSFSFLGGLANLLPGYLQGQRMANQDNWQDLMNYNQTMQGQLSNLFTEATWQPRINMFYENALRNNMQLQSDKLDFQQKDMLQPWALALPYAWSAMAGQNMWYDPVSYGQLGQRSLRGAVAGTGSTPSSLMR